MKPLFDAPPAVVVPLAQRIQRRAAAPRWRPGDGHELPSAPPAGDPSDLARQQLQAEVEGLARARAAVEETLDRYLAAVDRLERQLREVAAPRPEDVVELALLVAREILGREAQVDRDRLLAAIDETLPHLGDGTVVLRLSPADLAHLRARRPDLLRAGVELVADTDVSDGGCVMEATDRIVDVSIETRLAAVRGRLLEALTLSTDEERSLAAG